MLYQLSYEIVLPSVASAKEGRPSFFPSGGLVRQSSLSTEALAKVDSVGGINSLNLPLLKPFSEIEDAKVTEYEKFTNLVFKICDYHPILFFFSVRRSPISKN